jgi:hypothetical protein
MAAAEVGRLNARLLDEGLSYLLVGVRRWGSRDPSGPAARARRPPPAAGEEPNGALDQVPDSVQDLRSSRLPRIPGGSSCRMPVVS